MTPQPGLIPTNPKKFYLHHHLKAITDDAVPAEVQLDADHISLLSTGPAVNIWKEVTNTKRIESIILQRNKRHLQQLTIESGKCHDPIMKQIASNEGCNDIVTQLYNGEMNINEVTDELIQAFLRAIRETLTKAKDLPMIKE